MKIFLDDARQVSDIIKTPGKGPFNVGGGLWVITKSYDEFVGLISEHGLPEAISFDHDLSHEHYADQGGKDGTIDYSKFKVKTGFHCAQWLVEYCKWKRAKLPLWQVHSWNVVGAKNIKKLLTVASLTGAAPSNYGLTTIVNSCPPLGPA